MKWNNNNNLVPIIGGIIVFIFMCMDSEPGSNLTCLSLLLNC